MADSSINIQRRPAARRVQRRGPLAQVRQSREASPSPSSFPCTATPAARRSPARPVEFHRRKLRTHAPPPVSHGARRRHARQREMRLYVRQDSRELVAFAETPRADWMITLNPHAIDSVKTGREPHKSIQRGCRRARCVPIAPTRTTFSPPRIARDSPRDCRPCCLATTGSIGTSAGADPPIPATASGSSGCAAESYGKTVRLVLDMIDEESTRLDVDLSVTSSRHQYLFRDMAWLLEAWKS